MIILRNNEWTDQEEATISLLSDAVMFGVGVFETLRTFSQKRIFLLDEHIDRLFVAAKRVKLTLQYTKDEVRSMVQRVADRSTKELQRIKIMLFPDLLVITSVELILDQSIYDGVSLKSIRQRRSLPEIKCTSYLDCHLSYQEAQAELYYDALLIDREKEVYEASRANIFWFDQQETLYTKKDSVLPGIIREMLLREWKGKFQFQDISLPSLLTSKEVFLTNSVAGVVPVVEIDRKKIGNGVPGEMTQMACKLLKQKVEEYPPLTHLS